MPAAPPKPTGVSHLIADQVRALLAREIAEAEGCEVFFIGQATAGPDKTLCVTAAEAVARGDKSSVPAIMHLCRPGDVVIHNHPGGDLTPSGADIGIASTLGNLGVGFYIIDDVATHVRVVVKAMAAPQVEPLDSAALERDLAPGGPLARGLEDHENRPTQMQMLGAVAEAFNENQIAVIEAGTGTGKSLAYLLPALRWARANRQRVVISTSTINLQEQLIHKDLPLLHRHLDPDFSAVLVKGRQQYLCRRKLETLMRERLAWDFERPGSTEQVDEIAAWAEKSDDGSLSDLPFLPNDEVWERIESHSDTTLRVRCPHYDKCFFYQARRRAARADLLIANHSLLMSDLAIRQATNNHSTAAVLPPYQRVILDEAHNVEAAATSHFTRQVTRFGLLRLLARLVRSRRRESGLLPNVWRHVVDAMVKAPESALKSLADQLESPLKETRFDLGERVGEAFDRIEEAMIATEGREPRQGEEIAIRLTEMVESSSLWCNTVRPALEELARVVEEYTEKLRHFLRDCEELSDETKAALLPPLIDLRACVNQLAAAASNLRFLAKGRDDRHCLWISLRTSRRGTGHVTVAAAPLSVGRALREALFHRFPTVLLTSATLSVAGRFDHLRHTLGLDDVDTDRLRELSLPAPFDYERQALVAVASDMPDPGAPDAPAELAKFIAPAVMASRGRAFVLFTSHRMLRIVAERLAPTLSSAGLRVLRQGDTNRLALLRQFQEDPAAVLFATASFWEGVDVKGDGLVNLILTKLPFQVPTDPLLEARQEALTREGRDAFTELLLPHAVLKFKQGFGRLIRHRQDRGCVLLLDPRLVRRGYGRTFLRSLPTKAVKVMDSQALLGEVAVFFESWASDSSVTLRPH